MKYTLTAKAAHELRSFGVAYTRRYTYTLQQEGDALYLYRATASDLKRDTVSATDLTGWVKLGRFQ